LSQAYRFNLLPIIRDLEIILLRRLVVLAKQANQSKKTPIAKIIAAGRRDWHNWPHLARQRRAGIPALRQELRDYLEKQLIAQACEIILLPPAKLAKLLELHHFSETEQHQLHELRDNFGIKCRHYPAYLPDMQSMLEYTLRAATNPAERELVEAINLQFFHRLMLRPDLISELQLLEGKALAEISAPKTHESQEVFVRIWEAVIVPELGPRWQVTNYSLPFGKNSPNWAKIREDYRIINTAQSLSLANLPTRDNNHLDLAELVSFKKEEFDALLRAINPNFAWTKELLITPSTYLRNMVQQDLKKVDQFLEEIILRLTQPVHRDYLQAWEQLLIILIARHSDPTVFKDRLPTEFSPAEFALLQSDEALEKVAQRHFDRYLKRHKLPEWLEVKDIPVPTPAQITIDDLHRNFHTPVVALPIAAATIGKLV
jgi:hypothetical protein